MKKAKLVLKSGTKYIRDIDQTKNIVWTDDIQKASMFDLDNIFGERILKQICNILEDKGIQYVIKYIFIKEID